MLTEKQKIVLKFIEEYQLNHGKSPTIREMREFLNVSSDNSVLKHLNALTKKGFLEKDDTPRGIKLLDSVKQKLSTNTVSIPLLGHIPAGGPVVSDETVNSWMTFDKEQIPHPDKTFMLRVTGNSMIDAGIYEGDLLIADSQKEPKLFDIVIALVDNANTVKRLVKKDEKFYLQAENPEYNDIHPMEDLQVQGVVIGLIRTYK